MNDGDWTALCLAGKGGDLTEALRAGEVAAPQAQSILKPVSADLPKLHDTEFLLVYVDGAGRAKILRHPHGFAFARAGTALCTTKEKPVLRLPVVL